MPFSYTHSVFLFLFNKITSKMLTTPTTQQCDIQTNRETNRKKLIFNHENRRRLLDFVSNDMCECVANDRQNRQITMETVPRNGNCIRCSVLFCYFVSFFIIVLIFIIFFVADSFPCEEKVTESTVDCRHDWQSIIILEYKWLLDDCQPSVGRLTSCLMLIVWLRRWDNQNRSAFVSVSRSRSIYFHKACVQVCSVTRFLCRLGFAIQYWQIGW